jgi:2'-5' RNA ligase
VSDTQASVTGLAVPVRLPRPLATLRRRWDRAALAGAQPHVTILYPFLPAEALGPDVRRELAAIAGAIAPFEVRFDRLRRWDDLVWVEPADPRPFEGLTRLVVTRWPAYPPYGGLFDEVLVHLTVVESPTAPLDAVEAAARATLPFSGRADRLELWRQDAAGRWRPHWRLPFRQETRLRP